MEMLNYKDFSELTNDQQVEYLLALEEGAMKDFLNKVVKKKNNMLYIKLSSKTKGKKQSNSIIHSHSKQEDSKTVDDSILLELPLEKLKINPFQPRKFFNQEDIEELAQSIKKHGLIQRIVVTKIDDEYIIIVGERRYRAFQMLSKEDLKFKNIKVELVELDSEEMLAEWADVENNVRVDLSIIELAERLQFWRNRGYTTVDASKKMGIASSKAGRLSKVAEFPEEIKEKIYQYGINSDHMLEQISKVGDSEQQLALLKKISDGLRLEQLKNEVSKILDGSNLKKNKNKNIEDNPFSELIKWSKLINKQFEKLDDKKRVKIEEKMKKIEDIKKEIDKELKE